MKKEIQLFFLLLIIFIPQKIFAYCDDSEILKLQKIAKNVTVSYTFDEEKEEFSITFTNLRKELILYDVTNNREYNVYGELTLNQNYLGDNRFDIYAKKTNCTKEILVSKYIKLPFYNQYYKYDECKNISNYDYCAKWLNKSITYEFWNKKVLEYKMNQIHETEQKQEKIEISIRDRVLNFITKVYVNYYYIILPMIITVLCILIYIKNKQDSFF